MDVNTAFPVSLTPQTQESITRGIYNSYKGFLRRLLHASLEVAPEQLAVLNAAAHGHSVVTNDMLKMWASRLAIATSEEHRKLATELRNEAHNVVQGVLGMNALGNARRRWHLERDALGLGAAMGTRPTVAACRRWHSRFVRRGGAQAWISVQTQHARLAASLKDALGGVDTRALVSSSPTNAALETIASGLGAPGVASRGQVACASALRESGVDLLPQTRRRLLQRTGLGNMRREQHGRRSYAKGVHLATCTRGNCGECSQWPLVRPPCLRAERSGGGAVRMGAAQSALVATACSRAGKGVFADRFWVGANYVERVTSMELETYRSALQRIIAQTLQPHGEATNHPLQKILRPMTLKHKPVRR